MRNTMLLTATVLTLGAVACENKNPSSTGGPTPEAPMTQQNNAAPPAPVTNTNASLAADPLANVENKDKVKEYPDQLRIMPPRQARLITGFAAAIREAPAGESISTIETTEDVTEVARSARGDYDLIVYPDPKDSTKQLAGWVHRSALENTAWSTQGTASQGGSVSAATTNSAITKMACANGQAHLRTDRDFCAKSCKDDKGCDGASGELCDGLAFEVHEHTNKLSSARFCVSGSTPALRSPPSMNTK